MGTMTSPYTLPQQRNSILVDYSCLAVGLRFPILLSSVTLCATLHSKKPPACLEVNIREELGLSSML